MRDPLWLVAAAVALVATAASAAPRAPADYVYRGSIDLGAPGQWDYSSVDSQHARLYTGHADKITVVDLRAGKVAGEVAGLDEAHGAVAAPEFGRGFATSGGDGAVRVFDLATLKVLKIIPVGKDADSIIYDPGTKTVLVTIGDGKQLAIVDAASAGLARTVDLPGGPEFLAADGRGKVFVNLASTSQLARVDIASGKLEAVWPLAGCKSPHGLALDRRTNRLFAGCSNAVVDVVDAASGKTLATVPAGPYNDAVVVDEGRRLVFCPNGDGTLTVIGERPGDRYPVVRTLPTFFGARSMAIDSRTGTLYVVYGDMRIKGSEGGFRNLRFGWDGAKVAIFQPND